MSLGRNVEVGDERRHPLLRLFLLLFFLALLALAGAIAGGGIWLKDKMRTALPQLDGRVVTPGLSASVTVRRDHHGVPYIEAANLDDLLFAQGYVTAQDRLWEMDMARRMAAGDAAEILGPRLVEHDRMQRVLAMRPTAERITASLDARDRRYFEDYARGVNSFINSHQDRLPAEFHLLMYQPKQWQPVDSMLVVLSMVQMLDEHWPDKLAREQITARLGPTLAADLYPTGSWRDHPPVSTLAPITAPGQVLPDTPLDSSQDASLRDDLLPLLAAAAHTECLGCASGSNQWVVAGSRTASGQPMLSNDMHLPHQIPNIWYETGLEAPGFHVAGLTIPGLPMIVAGHNDHVAWGFTALYGDTQDIYVERVNEQDQYLGPDGAWHPIEHARETIHVRGGRNVDVDLERTGHGVVISSLIPGESRTLALRWSVYDSESSGYPLFDIDTATDWTGFRNALRAWWAPTQNVVYADDQGHIGYQAVGAVPARPNGLAGVPITDEQHEWQGTIPFDQLPSVYDPPDGILATANARITPDGYTTPVTLEWADPYRNERIWKWLEPKEKLTPQDMLTLQTDVYSELDQEIAQRLAYAIDHAGHAEPRLRQAADLLRSWNGVVGIDSAPAAIVNAAKGVFFPMLLRPKLGENWRLYHWAESLFAGEQILTNQSPAWLPAHYASWDDFLADVVRQGLNQDHAPHDLTSWRYGYAHPVDVEHSLFGLLPWFKRLTGTGPQPQSGDTTTVKQVGRTFGPSQRFTIDWSNVDGATENILMGESGDPLSPYYRDQWPYWYNGTSFALLFSDPAVSAATVHTLRLEP
ncbi:MAG TPA: penicillin acylase family protein [Acidobacteriaceae bacterium]|jgi:penicillin amidase|nr:penicillin acylase family protein [Acidobacteriaceae bacterium]